MDKQLYSGGATAFRCLSKEGFIVQFGPNLADIHHKERGSRVPYSVLQCRQKKRKLLPQNSCSDQRGHLKDCPLVISQRQLLLALLQKFFIIHSLLTPHQSGFHLPLSGDTIFDNVLDHFHLTMPNGQFSIHIYLASQQHWATGSLLFLEHLAFRLPRLLYSPSVSLVSLSPSLSSASGLSPQSSVFPKQFSHCYGFKRHYTSTVPKFIPPVLTSLLTLGNCQLDFTSWISN